MRLYSTWLTGMGLVAGVLGIISCCQTRTHRTYSDWLSCDKLIRNGQIDVRDYGGCDAESIKHAEEAAGYCSTPTRAPFAPSYAPEGVRMTKEEEEALFEKAHATWKPAQEAYLAAQKAASAASASYHKDPEVLAAFALLKRKQDEHGVTATDKVVQAAYREERKAWDAVERAFPDPDHGI